MAVLQPRTRLVYFRVSEEEFAQMKRMCAASGARSISEMARQAVRAAIEAGPGAAVQAALQERIGRLEERMHNLEAKLRGGVAAAAGSGF